MSQDRPAPRRPVAARHTRWATAGARGLVRAGLRPNAVSLASVVFSALTAAALLTGAETAGPLRAMLMLTAAAGVGLRGVCNLLDGLMAVEEGLGTKSGEIFNDLPDRFSDTIVLIAAGYVADGVGWGIELGWLAAVLAVLTAYARVLPAAAGAGHDFRGPMAKTHRMAVLTVCCLATAVEPWWQASGHSMRIGLALICAGCLVTIVRRTRRGIRVLEASP